MPYVPPSYKKIYFRNRKFKINHVKKKYKLIMSYWDIQYPTPFYTNLPFNTYPMYNNFMFYQEPTPDYLRLKENKTIDVNTIPIFTTCACTKHETDYECFIKRKYMCHR